VWGLGATLHHAVSGSVPFPRREEDRDSEDPAVRFPQLVAEPGPLPDGVQAELRKLILATLGKDPTERPTAAEIAAALEPLVAELPSKLVLSRRGARLG
jgi:serine/threonine protein kinase